MTSKSQKKSKSKTTRSSKIVKSVKAEVTVPETDLSDYQVIRNIDSSGIRVTITCKGQSVHTFILSSNEFMNWRSMSPQLRAAFVLSRTNGRVFGNNAQLIYLVIQVIVNTIDSVIPTLQREQALRTALMRRA